MFFFKLNKPFLVLFVGILSTSFSQQAIYKSNKHRLIPVLGFKPETHLIFGANLKTILKVDTSHTQRISTMDNLAYFTTRKQFVIRNKFDYFSDRWFTKMYNRFQYFPYSYFGIGNNTSNSERVVLQQAIASNGSFDRILKSFLFLGLDYEFRFDNFKNLETQVFDKEYNLFLLGLGPSLIIDKREHNLYPKKGYYLSLENLNSTSFKGYNYTHNAIDFRWYHTLWNDRNIIAIQLHSKHTFGDIPFYRLNQLGGDESLRGFHENRFMDKHATYFQCEGRKHFYKRWKLAGFAGTGLVYGMSNDMQLHTAIGGGLRYELIENSRLNLRGDLTLNDEGNFAIYIGMNEAF